MIQKAEESIQLSEIAPQINWLIGRLIAEKIATREALETHYSFDDVIEDNEILDAWATAESIAQKKRSKKKPED